MAKVTVTSEWSRVDNGSRNDGRGNIRLQPEGSRCMLALGADRAG